MWQKLRDAVSHAIYAGLKQYAARLLSAGAAAGLMMWVVLFSGIEQMGSWFWDYLPPQLQGQLGSFAAVFENANYWFPVAEMLGLILVVWTFVLSFITIKLFIKIFLPALG